MAPNSGESIRSEIDRAIDAADPYRRQGTKYLHSTQHNDVPGDKLLAIENPTGAVVVPISLATTFKQVTPGQPSAKEDPNSFGLGYEYSRTGMCEQILNQFMPSTIDLVG